VLFWYLIVLFEIFINCVSSNKHFIPVLAGERQNYYTTIRKEKQLKTSELWADNQGSVPSKGHHVQTSFATDLLSYPSYGALLSRDKSAECELLHSRSVVENVWRVTSSPAFVFMACSFNTVATSAFFTSRKVWRAGKFRFEKETRNYATFWLGNTRENIFEVGRMVLQIE
jgi:hypothetical protein